MPGRVVVQFVEGVVPATGHAKTGLNSFDTVASSFGIYRIHKAFPIIATVASKRALSPAARELDRMYYIEYSGPFDPWEVVSRLLGSKEVERAEPHFMYEFEGGVYPPATRGYIFRRPGWSQTTRSTVIRRILTGWRWRLPGML